MVKEGGDHYTVCGPDNNTASALADLFVTSNLACLVPPLLTDELFAQDAPAPLLTFSSDGQLAALEIVPITSSPCQVSVRLGGDLGPSFQMQRFPLHLDAGGGPPRTIVVPLEIAIQEIDQLACDAGAVPEPCTIVSDQETALACVRP